MRGEHTRSVYVTYSSPSHGAPESLKLALSAVVLSAVAFVLAIAVGQGLLPWAGSTGPITK